MDAAGGCGWRMRLADVRFDSALILTTSTRTGLTCGQWKGLPVRTGVKNFALSIISTLEKRERERGKEEKRKEKKRKEEKKYKRRKKKKEEEKKKKEEKRG